ncbi:MAG: prolyl oligopeptidase family serine peptidase [Bacteroidales bacterium]|nr:prolyl oligopeptidase family serine peptidase [Bacteroidales bacterium]
MNYKRIIFISIILSIISINSYAQYMKPCKEIEEIIDNKPLPSVLFTTDLNKMIEFQWSNLSSIEDLNEPELKLAGLRFNPMSNCITRVAFCYNIEILDIKNNIRKKIQDLPPNPKIRSYQLSPDQKKLCFTNKTQNSVELWVIDLEKYQAQKIADKINETFTTPPIDWSGDSKYVYYLKCINDNKIPSYKTLPSPKMEQSNANKNGTVIYQDLLKNENDELMFDYFTYSKIIKQDINNSSTKEITQGVISEFSVSPDGKYILAKFLNKPYSYSVPYSQFANSIKVINTEDCSEEIISENNLSERAFSNVNSGTRNVTWQNNAPHTLFMVSALDNGNNRALVNYRDKIITYEINNKPISCIKLKNRFNDINWLSDTIAIVSESNTKTKEIYYFRINTTKENLKYDTLYIYNKEITPQTKFMQNYNKLGRKTTICKDNTFIYIYSIENSKQGEIPTLKKLNINTKKVEIIWQSEPPYYSQCITINPQTENVIIETESQKEYPNFYLQNLNKKTFSKKITNYKSTLQTNIKSKLITYTREDGLQLSGTLYLPVNSPKNKPLPTLIWAYPIEYSDKTSAGQIKSSPFKFSNITSSSPIVLTMAGYAVLDNTAFPIISTNGTEPNDDFINQIKMNAKAAVKTLVEMGISDSTKIAIGGHSYGAFLAVNLLAHTDLFSAGIARSGAYNRTLTPFGFQNEKRTFWQAKETYLNMSPFMYADKITKPLLLIHGEEDNNSATNVIQSERMYSAIKECGGIARLVILPKEGHYYNAKESILHVAWETQQWLDTYLKNNSETTK